MEDTMFREIRYQTGEINDIITEMKKGNIPCMDVDDSEDMARFIKELSTRNFLVVQDMPFNRNARDRVKEPEFEFRVAFSEIAPLSDKNDINNVKFIDFYFEPDVEESYDSILGD
jgi:hypothetical protein